MSADDRARADAAASTLLLVLEALGVKAVILMQDEGQPMVVLVQSPDDALPMCQKAIKEYDVPADRTIQ